MKSSTLSAVALLAAFFSPMVYAQVSITEFGTAYTENFSSFVGTEASVPTNFTFSDADYTPGGFYTFDQAYNNGNSNYAFRSTSTSMDYAFGQKGPTSGTDFLNWTFVNNTGSSITSFLISWTAIQYSSGGRATLITQNYNANLAGFSQVGLTGNVYTAITGGVASGEQLSSIVTQSFEYILTLGTPLENGQSLILGWGFANGAGTSSNAHVAIDNLSLTAVPEPSTYTALAGALVLAGVMVRRRRRV